MARRGVKNIVRIRCQDSAKSSGAETMPYAMYLEAIEKPVRERLAKVPGVDFIVLTKGIPIRLTGAPTGVSGTQPSLDSTLACLGYASIKDAIPVSLSDSGFTGKCWFNRFWNPTQRFSHAKFGGYLVTRLDGYTVEDAKSLVAYAVQSEKVKPSGKFLLDVAEGHGIGHVDQVPFNPVVEGKPDLKVINEMAYNEWDADLVVAGQKLASRGLPTRVDRTENFVGRVGELMGYASWGSNDPKFDDKGYKMLRFDPGGIAETAVSTSARTFLSTSGGQSLIADLIRGGASGAKGYCDEPLLQAVASPTILFDKYTRGWTLAESYYAASRFVGWEDIVVGDPICSPYQPSH